MKLFSIDSPVYKFMQRLWDVFKLNMLWLLCSLPIITIGISTTAAFKVTLDMVDDKEGKIAHDFFKAFKENWKQGIPLSFIMIICPLAVWYDFQIYNALETNSLPFLLLGVFTAFIFTFSLLYLFPLIARYENSVINSLRNSFELSMKFFGRTILLVLIVAFEFAVLMWNTTTLFVGLLIGPVCIIYTISGTAMHIFHEMEKIPGSVRENEPEEKSDGNDSDKE